MLFFKNTTNKQVTIRSVVSTMLELPLVDISGTSQRGKRHCDVTACWPLTNISWDESGSKPIKTWPSGIHGNKPRWVFVYPELPSGLCLLCFLQVSESWRHTTLLLHTHNRKCRRASSHTWKTHKHKHTCALWGQTGISTHQVVPPGVHLHLTSDSEHSLKPLPLTIVQSQQRTDQSTWDPDVSLTCPVIQHQPDQYRESEVKPRARSYNNLHC